MIEKVLQICLVILLGVAVVLLITVATTKVDEPFNAFSVDESQLGGILVFPDGYELVASYSRGNDGRFAVYICRNIDTREYRECVPEKVETE